MITRIKTLIAKQAMMKLMKNINKPCACGECIYLHKQKNEIPCVCPKLDLPCIALKSKYTSAKALSDLISGNRTSVDGEYMVMEYNDEYFSADFISAALEHHNKMNKGVQIK